eukprot:gene8165-5694_t
MYFDIRLFIWFEEDYIRPLLDKNNQIYHDSIYVINVQYKQKFDDVAEAETLPIKNYFIDYTTVTIMIIFINSMIIIFCLKVIVEEEDISIDAKYIILINMKKEQYIYKIISEADSFLLICLPSANVRLSFQVPFLFFNFLLLIFFFFFRRKTTKKNYLFLLFDFPPFIFIVLPHSIKCFPSACGITRSSLSLLINCTGKKKKFKMKNEYERVNVHENCKLKFSRLATIDYKAKGSSVVNKWEMVQRTTRTIPWDAYNKSPAPLPLDAVEICATLKRGHERFLILVVQYRPPLDSLVVEFPAGLIDANESPEQTTIRELLEETGYHVSMEDIEHVSPPIAPEPGLADSCAKLVKVTVNGDLDINSTPKQELDEGEDIEVVLLPISDKKNMMKAMDQLVSLKEKDGHRTIITKMWTKGNLMMQLGIVLTVTCLCSLAYGYPAEDFPINWSTVTSDSDVVRNLNSPYLGMCVCDHIYGVCDPNCCCDPDCDDAKEFFWECLLQQSGYPPFKSCVEQNSATEIERINVKNVVKIPGQGGALCLVRTNHPSNIFKYFEVPTQVSNPTDIDNQWTVKQPLQMGQLLGLLKYTEVDGKMVFRNYGTLTIPTQNPHGSCSIMGKPVPFMTPIDKMSCVLNGAQLCERYPLNTFYHLFIDDNKLFAPLVVHLYDKYGELMETIDPTSSTPKTESIVVANVCQNGVIQMRLMIEYNSTDIIKGAFHIQLADVPVKRFTPIIFEVSFLNPGSTLPSNIISGTPGYSVGNRVRGGTMVSHGDLSAISERKNGFPSRAAAAYYNIISSGCSFVVSEKELQEMCETGSESAILDILGQSRGVLIDYVARTNDALVNDTASWVKIEGLTATNTPGVYDPVRRRCDNIAVGMQYTIATAKAGVIYNPQTVIVGVFADFLRGSFVLRNSTDFTTDATAEQHVVFKVQFNTVEKQNLLGKKIEPPPILPRIGLEKIFIGTHTHNMHYKKKKTVTGTTHTDIALRQTYIHTDPFSGGRGLSLRKYAPLPPSLPISICRLIPHTPFLRLIFYTKRTTEK